MYLYMGKALQLKYRFDDAINAYKEFIKKAGTGAAKKFDTERLIETCNNANELMKTRVNTVVKSSREVSIGAIYNAYDAQNSAGKLLAASYRFLTSTDAKKMTTPMMFLTADGQTIYYASYGKSDADGKDIYIIHKLPSGDWGAPQNLGKTVNTKYDEGLYPLRLDADDKATFLPALPGHNSMGGYDLFKTTYNPAANQWSEPENLGAGINSPDDDIFYMPVADGEAQFASAKETAKGMLTVYRVEVASSGKVRAAIRGKYQSVDQARADGKISVLRKSDKVVSPLPQTRGRASMSFLFPPVMTMKLWWRAEGIWRMWEDFSLPKMDKPVTIVQQMKNDEPQQEMRILEFATNICRETMLAWLQRSFRRALLLLRMNIRLGSDTSKHPLQPFTLTDG